MNIEEAFAEVRKNDLDGWGRAALDHIEGYVEQCADFQRAAEQERDALEDALVGAHTLLSDCVQERDSWGHQNARLRGERDALKEQVERLRAGNAALTDQHNRESHGTASHEALAYHDVVKERDALKAALEERGYPFTLERENDALKASEDDWRRAAEQATERGMAAEAEVERLRDALDAVDMLEDARSAYDRVKKERDALKEENDRLKSMDLHSSCHKREDALKARWTQLAADLDVHEDDLFESIKSNVRYSYMMREQRDRLESERDALKAALEEEVERHRVASNERDALKTRVGRLRKALNWMRGCFDPESWEYKRATAVLEEENCPGPRCGGDGECSYHDRPRSHDGISPVGVGG